MNILITGGSGFIGQSFINKFREYEYTIIDINKSKIPVKTEINKLIEDLTDQELLEYINNCDVVLHLAAEKLHNSVDNTKIYDSNITATFRICNILSKIPKKVRLFFTSSLYAYGYNGAERVKMKEDNPVKNFSLYGTSKYISEHLIKTLLKEKQNFNIVRLFFAYGPMQLSVSGYKSVIRRNLELLIKNQPAEIYGSGNAVLDYIYIEDVIDFINKTILDKYVYDVVNLGSGNEYTIKNIIIKLCELYGSKNNFEYTQKDWTEGTYRVANTVKLKSLSKDYLKHNIDTGLSKIIKEL